REARLTALRRGVVGPGPASVPVAGSGAKAPRHQAFLPGCGAGLFVSAITSRGRRHIPLRLQDRLAKAPLTSGILATWHALGRSQYQTHNVFIISICICKCARIEIARRRAASLPVNGAARGSTRAP